MSYGAAKEVLRKTVDKILQSPTGAPSQEYLIYDVGTALFQLIEALETDLTAMRSDLDRIKKALGVLDQT